MENKKNSLESIQDYDSNSKMEDKQSVKSKDLIHNEDNDNERNNNDKIPLIDETVKKW